MYNLLEGVAHFFDDLSADVVSIILNTPINEDIDYEKLLEVAGLSDEEVTCFMEQLLNVGLITTFIPGKKDIDQYREYVYKWRCSHNFATDQESNSQEETPLELSTAEMRYANALEDEGIITSVMFELTYNCSERCIHCYNIGATRNDTEVSGRNLPSELGLEDYKRVIDELYEQGLVKVCLSGGDPFSKPCVWDVIDYLRFKGIAFDIFTNGQRLVGSEARLAGYYPRLVGVSIYSAESQVHDKITRINGSLRKSEMVMERLCRLGVPLNLKCCVMRLNVKTYRTVITIAKKYNAVPQIEVNLTDSIEGDKCVSNYLRLSEREFDVILRDKDVPLYVGPESRYFHGAERHLSDNACGAGKHSVCLTPDGDIIPCCTFHYSFGNVKNRSVFEILKSQNRKWWLSCTLEKYKDCARHDYCSYCNLCPGVNFSEHRTPLFAGENNCFLAKVRCNLARKLMKGDDPLKGMTIDEAIMNMPDPEIGSIRRMTNNERKADAL